MFKKNFKIIFFHPHLELWSLTLSYVYIFKFENSGSLVHLSKFHLLLHFYCLCLCTIMLYPADSGLLLNFWADYQWVTIQCHFSCSYYITHFLQIFLEIKIKLLSHGKNDTSILHTTQKCVNCSRLIPCKIAFQLDMCPLEQPHGMLKKWEIRI